MKKKIKVKFLDVVGDPENNFIVDILKERYDVEISENPEYLFFESKSKGFLDYKKDIQKALDSLDFLTDPEALDKKN